MSDMTSNQPQDEQQGNGQPQGGQPGKKDDGLKDPQARFREILADLDEKKKILDERDRTLAAAKDERGRKVRQVEEEQSRDLATFKQKQAEKLNQVKSETARPVEEAVIKANKAVEQYREALDRASNPSEGGLLQKSALAGMGYEKPGKKRS